MGSIENETQEVDSNGIEKLKASEILAQNPNCEPLTPDTSKLDSEGVVTESGEQKKVAGAQNVEKKSDLREESPGRMKEMGQNPADKSEPISENVKKSTPLEKVLSQNGPTHLEKLPAGSTPLNPCSGKLESLQKDTTNDPGHLENDDKGTNTQPRKRKSKLLSPVTSSWSLRSKSQEKNKASELNEIVKEGSADGEKIRRQKKKKQTSKSPVNEFSRTRTHLRYLLSRIKYEQSLIDAYSDEGWRGQSLEKLKPEKELERAKSHILRYKLRIRELFRSLDMSLVTGKLPDSLFDSVGEIESEDIFCAKCGSEDVSLDNDIILCDGACERGFHQFCLEPPLLKEEIPPDDEGWLCPGCDCKVDCIDMLEDVQGTDLSFVDSWEKIFPEAAASGKKPDDGSVSSSDDSEDDDYDPENPDNSLEKVQSSSDKSDYFSAPDDLAAFPDDEKNSELFSDDSSSDFMSDSEDLRALIDEDQEHTSPSNLQPIENKLKNREVSPKGRGLKSELAYLLETGEETTVSGKRHVERLDYKKLLEETYGNSSSDSSDEDFDDSTSPKRRKISHEKTVAVTPNKTPITKSEIKKTEEKKLKESPSLTKKTLKKTVEGGKNKSSPKDGSASTGTKTSANKRLGEATTQRLYESFNENHYPERAVKENLAKELGITVQQASKWFENARWSFNHRPQMDSNITEKPSEPPQVTENTSGVENLVTDSNGENSKGQKSRKRKGKINHASNDILVTGKTREQNTPVETRSSQLGKSSKRQTRSSKNVS